MVAILRLHCLCGSTRVCQHCTGCHLHWQYMQQPPYPMGRPRLLFTPAEAASSQSVSGFYCAALVLQVGQSGWTRPLPLENGGVGSEVEDFNTQPVLIRAKIPEWGTVHEVVARTELVGRGFERTLVRSWGGCRLCCCLPLALAAGRPAAEPELGRVPRCIVMLEGGCAVLTGHSAVPEMT